LPASGVRAECDALVELLAEWTSTYTEYVHLDITHTQPSTPRQFRPKTRSASQAMWVLVTYGDRSFPVAAVRVWNSLPQHVVSASSLSVFCPRLKSHFFSLLLIIYVPCLRSDTVILDTLIVRTYLLTYLLTWSLDRRLSPSQ